MLLISAGLLVQAFRKVLHVDPGFRPENVMTYRISLPEAKYAKSEQQVTFFRNLVDRLRSMPVKSAGAASAPPLGGHSGWFFRAEGGRAFGPKDPDPVVLPVITTPGYFDAIGITFLAGRTFAERDGDPKGSRVAIVNQSFAQEYWPEKHQSQDLIGKRIRYSWDKDKWMQVVGVTGDEKHYGLDQEMRPSVYVPHRQMSNSTMSIVLRGAIELRGLVNPAREILRQIDPGLPMFDIWSMTETLQRGPKFRPVRYSVPAGSEDTVSRTHAWLRHRPAHPTDIRRRAAGGRRLALSRAPADAHQRLGYRGMGTIGKEPPGALLPLDGGRPETIRHGNLEIRESNPGPNACDPDGLRRRHDELVE